MKHWYEKLENEDRDAQFLQVAYTNTFCNEESGTQVLCHLDILVQDIMDDPETHPEAKLMARKLFEAIIHNCGIIHNYEYTKAITGSAQLIEIGNGKNVERE